MTAGADEYGSFALSRQLHPLVADRTAGIGRPGYRLPVTALPVLADQQSGILSINGQKPFSAAGAFFIRQIVVTESAFLVRIS